MPFHKIPKDITEKLNAMSAKEIDALAKLMGVMFLKEEKDTSEKAFMLSTQPVKEIRAALKKMSLSQLKKDKYSEARGGYSRLFDLRCRKCNTFITLYQKDDPKNVVGSLRRLYLDRFIPAKTKAPAILNCNKCKEPLGTLYIYEKENRKAYRLYQDAIVKKLQWL